MKYMELNNRDANTINAARTAVYSVSSKFPHEHALEQKFLNGIAKIKAVFPDGSEIKNHDYLSRSEFVELINNL